MKGFVSWKIGPTSYLPIPTFHCSICGQDTKSFSICLKCEPQTYEVGMINYLSDSDENIDMFKRMEVENASAARSLEEIKKQVWNEAIEAAAEYLDLPEVPTEHRNHYADEIRKLKK